MRKTPPAIPTGTFGTGPQPRLPAHGGLVLRPWETSDAAVFLGAYSDSEINQWHTRQPRSADEVLAWFEQYGRDWSQEIGAHWAVTRGGGEVLGRIALGSVNRSDGVGGCGYWVLPAARGAGVAGHALNAMTDWAFTRAGFHRLHLDHSTRNHASCRVATKSGFTLEGTMRSAAVHTDGRHDMHLHARIHTPA